MNQVLELCFKYRQQYYSCVVGILHGIEDMHIHIEFIDYDLIEIFQTADLIYRGERGYRKLPAFEDNTLRPLLIHLGNLIVSVQSVLKNQY